MLMFVLSVFFGGERCLLHAYSSDNRTDAYEL